MKSPRPEAPRTGENCWKLRSYGCFLPWITEGSYTSTSCSAACSPVDEKQQLTARTLPWQLTRCWILPGCWIRCEILPATDEISKQGAEFLRGSHQRRQSISPQLVDSSSTSHQSLESTQNWNRTSTAVARWSKLHTACYESVGTSL